MDQPTRQLLPGTPHPTFRYDLAQSSRGAPQCEQGAYASVRRRHGEQKSWYRHLNDVAQEVD
jgi:hypothetical protein